MKKRMKKLLSWMLLFALTIAQFTNLDLRADESTGDVKDVYSGLAIYNKKDKWSKDFNLDTQDIYYFCNATDKLTQDEKVNGIRNIIEYESGDSEYPYYIQLLQIPDKYTKLVTFKGTTGNGDKDVLVGINSDGTYKELGSEFQTITLKLKDKDVLGNENYKYYRYYALSYKKLDDSSDLSSLDSDRILNLNYTYEIERGTYTLDLDNISNNIWSRSEDYYLYTDMTNVSSFGNSSLSTQISYWEYCNEGAYSDSMSYDSTRRNWMSKVKEINLEGKYNTWQEMEEVYKKEEDNYWDAVDKEGWYTFTYEDFKKMTTYKSTYLNQDGVEVTDYYETYTVKDDNTKRVAVNFEWFGSGTSDRYEEQRNYFLDILSRYHNIKLPSTVEINGENYDVYYCDYNPLAIGAQAFSSENDFLDNTINYNLWLDDNFKLSSDVSMYRKYNDNADLSSLTNKFDLTYKDNGFPIFSQINPINYVLNITGLKIGSGVTALPDYSIYSYSNVTHLNLQNAKDLEYICSYNDGSGSNVLNYLDFSNTKVQYISNNSLSYVYFMRFNPDYNVFIISSTFGASSRFIFGLRTNGYNDSYYNSFNTYSLSAYATMNYDNKNKFCLYFYDYLKYTKYMNSSPIGFYMHDLAYLQSIETLCSGCRLYGTNAYQHYVNSKICDVYIGNSFKGVSSSEGGTVSKAKLTDLFYSAQYYPFNMYIDIFEDDWNSIFAEDLDTWRSCMNVYLPQKVTYENMYDTDMSDTSKYPVKLFNKWKEYCENPDNEWYLNNYDSVEYIDTERVAAPKAREGYDFLGYTLVSNGNEEFLPLESDGYVTLPTDCYDSFKLVAKWATKVSKVTYMDDTTELYNDYVTYEGSSVYDVTPTKTSTSTDTSTTTYTFDKWVDNNGNSASSNLACVKSDLTVYSSYTSNTTDRQIVSKVLDHITISTPPDKVTYTVGDKFDKTGMVVDATYKVTYDNGVVVEITDKDIKNYTVDTTSDLALTDNNRVVSLTDNNITKTANQAITVNDIASGDDGEKTAIVKGCIRDKNGNPIQGLKVELHSDLQTATTDADGNFIFDNSIDLDEHTLTAYDANDNIIYKMDLNLDFDKIKIIADEDTLSDEFKVQSNYTLKKDSLVVEVNADGCEKHNNDRMEKENLIDATCIKAGSYDEVWYCSTCLGEYSRERKNTSALGHNYGDWEEVSNPTQSLINGAENASSISWDGSSKVYKRTCKRGSGHCLSDNIVAYEIKVAQSTTPSKPVVTPTAKPTAEPTAVPTEEPTYTLAPYVEPTTQPTQEPTLTPTEAPTVAPTNEPTLAPTDEPTAEPTVTPTEAPTVTPYIPVVPTVTPEPGTIPKIKVTATLPPVVTKTPEPDIDIPTDDYEYVIPKTGDKVLGYLVVILLISSAIIVVRFRNRKKNNK